MRADARRNRELLVDRTRDVFSAQGAGASMEAIAKQAGVGVGTLYRHFPNRLDLVEAVYQTDVEELWATAQRVVGRARALAALEAFFDAFIRYAQTKQALLSRTPSGLREEAGVAGHRHASCIESSFDLVIDRAKEAGVVRADVDGSDVMQLVSPGLHQREHPARADGPAARDDPRRHAGRGGPRHERLLRLVHRLTARLFMS